MNVSPDATTEPFSLNVTGSIPSTTSVAEAVNVTDAPDAEVASVDVGALAVTTGAVVSTTSKLNCVVPVFFAASLADATIA